MIDILFFASLREQLGVDRQRLNPDDQPATIGDLKQLLVRRGGVWSEVFSQQQVLLCSVNQQMADDATKIQSGDEVAFFPPVSGG